MFETRPELIVETGTYRGGSALYLASLCDLVGGGDVVSIDIEPMRDDYPRTRGSRISRAARRPTLEWSRRYAGARGPSDSRHPRLGPLAAHVEEELAVYAPLVPVGCYLIVEDSNIGRIRKDLMPGPHEAIESFLGQRTNSRSIAHARSS